MMPSHLRWLLALLDVTFDDSRMTTIDPEASGSSAVAVPAAIPAGRYRRVSPHAYFLVSAVFHYLGPAFAVLLFARVDVLGVAWLRIAAAAAVFALWRRPGGTGRTWTARPVGCS